MDQNEKTTNDKIAKMESEIKVLKNEVQAVLLDLRESYLNNQNPFNSTANPAATIQPIVIQEQVTAREPQPERQPQETQKSEPVKAEKEHSKTLQVAEFDPETIRGKVKKPLDSYPQPEPRIIKSAEPDIEKKVKLDLVTVAGLTGWVEGSTKKIGKARTEAVLDISEAMGFVNKDLKPIIAKLIALAPKGSAESSTGTRDYIDSLIKLNSLLGKDNREETALLLLSLVSGDKTNG
jgi:hypothetical protein